MTDKTLFMVYDDETGSFVDINLIQRVEKAIDVLGPCGSWIYVADRKQAINSPLKPREILRRISIIRYKHGLTGKSDVVHAQPDSVSESPAPRGEMDTGSVLPKK